MEIVLASASPRRREILENLGISFTCVCPEVDEKSDRVAADEMVRALSLKKAEAAAELLRQQGKLKEDTLIIAADTAVIHNMNMLGKPKTPKKAADMLAALSGQTHFVTTGITLMLGNAVVTESELTKISFTSIGQAQIDAYVASGEPMDKAGAYAVQGMAALWIDRIEGDYFNVVGFPVHRFYTMIKSLGLEILPGQGIVSPQ